MTFLLQVGAPRPPGPCVGAAPSASCPHLGGCVAQETEGRLEMGREGKMDFMARLEALPRPCLLRIKARSDALWPVLWPCFEAGEPSSRCQLWSNYLYSK